MRNTARAFALWQGAALHQHRELREEMREQFHRLG
jgi:hypothetical protein